MAKRYDDPIEVVADPTQGTAPRAFSWRGRTYEIDEWLMSWREAGEWWNGGGREREYFRVVARPFGQMASGDVDADGFLVTPGAVYDIYRDRFTDTWKMARLWD